MIETTKQVRVAILATILLAHCTRTNAQGLAFSPDGRTLASEGGGGVDRLDKLESTLDALEARLARRFAELEKRLDPETRPGTLVGKTDMNRDGGGTSPIEAPGMGSPGGAARPNAVQGVRNAGQDRQLSPSEKLELSARGYLPPSAGCPRDRARAAASEGSGSAATATESVEARLDRLEQRLLLLDTSLSKKFEDLEKHMAPVPANRALSR